jgi:lysophospholipase L1-like esterase
MAFNLGRFDSSGNPSRILWIGDSITGTFGGSVSPAVIAERLVRALFGAVAMPSLAAPFLAPIYKSPMIGQQDGVAGRECKTIAANAGVADAPTMDAYLLPFSAPYTHAVVQLGINDSVAVQGATTTIALVGTASAMILSRLLVKKGIPGSNVLWIGPSSHPTPAIQTVTTTQIDPTIRASCTAVGASYLTCSDLDSSATNTVDGVHPNQAGAVLWGARWATGFTVTG